MLYLAAIAFCVNVVLWIILYKRLDKRYSPDAFLEGIRDRVDVLLLEINRVTDRNLTLIDSRRNELRALLQEIEEKRFTAGDPRPAPPTPPAPPVPLMDFSLPGPEAKTIRRQVEDLFRQGVSREKIAEHLGLSVSEVELYTL